MQKKEYFKNLFNQKEIRIVIYLSICKLLDTLRIIWSPNLCLFEKIENLNNINDKSFDVY